MTRPQWSVVGGVAFLAIAAMDVAWSSSRGASANRVQQVYNGVSAVELQIAQIPSPPGVLEFRADAKIAAFKPQRRAIWWQLEVRQPRDGELVSLWETDYREGWKPLAAGRKGSATFHERFTDLPGGTYDVFLTLVEGINDLAADGAIIKDHTPIGGQSGVMTVR